MCSSFHKIGSTKLWLAIILVSGLVIGGTAGYLVPNILLGPVSRVHEITLIDATVKEAGSTQLKIPITNNDPGNPHLYTVNIRTDPSISVYIGNTLLPSKDNVHNHTFYLDSGDSIIKKYIIRVGTLPEPTTSISFNIEVTVYIDNEEEPIAQRNLEITIKK